MTITAPYLDTQQTFAPAFSGPSQITAPFLDTLATYAPTITEVNAEALELEVGGAVVTDAFARQFEELIADTGSFSFQMVREDFAGVDFDDLVKFKMDGTARFLGVVEQIDHTVLAQGEEADQVVTVSGRGALALLEQHVVYPSRGVGALPIEEVRSFSWVAPDFDSSSWPNAKQVNRQRDYATWRAPLPHIWPDTTAYWIWANLSTVNSNFAPTGVCLFRKTFSLASEETVRIFCAFDFTGRLYLDGAELTAFASFTTGRYVDVTLSAGTHLLAARVSNEPKPTLPNPGGFICAAYTVGDAGLLSNLIVHTDATWDCLPYPSAAPGFTHGEVIRLLFEEAGIDGDWTLDFTDTKDTSGEAWGEYREITVGVGRTLLEVLREMSDTYLDVAVAPGSLTLRAWNRGTRGATTSAVLQQTSDPDTSDFLSLSHTGKRTRLNKALIRYAGGHTEREDTTSTGLYGVRGGYIEVGAIQGEAQAEKAALELMENRSAPAYAATGTLHPRSDAATPYKAFQVADWVTAPDETDTPSLMRVLSVAMAEDENGIIDWPVRLRDQQLELEERHDIWLRRMADGASLGGARISSRAGTPAPAASQITALRVAEFSYDNTALVASSSPRRPAEVSGNIVEVYGELTTAGSSPTSLVVKLNGSTLTTLTFAAGETETEEPIVIEPVKANVDKLQVEIVSVGTGAEGLDVQVRAI